MACTLPLVLPIFTGSISASSDDSRGNSALARTVCSITLAKRGWSWMQRPTRTPSPATSPKAAPAANSAGDQCIVAHRSTGFTTKGLSRSFTQASPKRRTSRRLSNASSHNGQLTLQASSSSGPGAGDHSLWAAAPQIGAAGSDGLVVVSSVGSDNHNSTSKPYSGAPRAPAAQRKQQKRQQQQPGMRSHSSSAGAAQVVSKGPAKIWFAAVPNSKRSAGNHAASARSPIAAVTSTSAAAAGAVTTGSATASSATTAAAHGSKQQPTQHTQAKAASQHIRSAGGCILRSLRSFGASICFGLSLSAPDAGAWAAGRHSFCGSGPFQLGRRYRAKFITGTVQALKSKPAGGAAWLMSLRHVPFSEAVEALCTLPGVGPKVAACICLFSLDKHDAIPVDTHVWQLATRYYAPQLAGKTLTPKLHGVVQEVFVERFGPYAGWAHNTLFISELASHRGLLPEQLRSPLRGERRKLTGTGGTTGKRRSSSIGAGNDAAAVVASPGRSGAGGTAGKRRSSSVGAGAGADGAQAGAASATPARSGAMGSGGGKRRRSSSIGFGGAGGAAAQAAMLAAAGSAPAGAGAVGVKAEPGVEGLAVNIESGPGAQVPALRRGGRARQASKRLADGDGEAAYGADEGRPSSQASLEEVKEEEVLPPGSTKRRRKKGADGD